MLYIQEYAIIVEWTTATNIYCVFDVPFLSRRYTTQQSPSYSRRCLYRWSAAHELRTVGHFDDRQQSPVYDPLMTRPQYTYNALWPLSPQQLGHRHNGGYTLEHGVLPPQSAPQISAACIIIVYYAKGSINIHTINIKITRGALLKHYVKSNNTVHKMQYEITD